MSPVPAAPAGRKKEEEEEQISSLPGDDADAHPMAQRPLPTPRLSVGEEVSLGHARALRPRRRPGAGPTPVLLHGLPDCCEGWLAVVEATDRAYVAFAVPGFGGSDLPRAPRPESDAEDIKG